MQVVLNSSLGVILDEKLGPRGISYKNTMLTSSVYNFIFLWNLLRMLVSVKCMSNVVSFIQLQLYHEVKCSQVSKQDHEKKMMVLWFLMTFWLSLISGSFQQSCMNSLFSLSSLLKMGCICGKESLTINNRRFIIRSRLGEG